MGRSRDPQPRGGKWGSSTGSDLGRAHHRPLGVYPELRRGQSPQTHGLAAQGAVLSPSAFKFLGAEPLLSPGDRAARPKPLTTRSQRSRRKGGLQSSCLSTLLFHFLLKVLFRNKTSLHMAASQVSMGT